MHLSRIRIQNFRNFSSLDIAVAGNIVVVGENRVGKSNLLYALRLLLDPTLPDSSRQLGLSDFWDGLANRDQNTRILVSAEISDFEADLDVLAVLTDFRLAADPHRAKLTYEFRPKAGLAEPPASNDDYDFICYGGDDEARRFGHDLRRRLTFELLPALRDAEGDLSVWRRSPLRPLVEEAAGILNAADLQDISDRIQAATQRLVEFEPIRDLQQLIGREFRELTGELQDIRPRLGFNPTDPALLYRSIRLLIDEGRRGIADASLGSANLVFLSLKALEIARLIDANSRDHTFLAIEEPEAHLHPHLQRSVYRHLFERAQMPLSVLMTTHSPHIVSVTPLRSVVLLKDRGPEGTVGRSTAQVALAAEELADLQRYLDVTRAEILFARSVVLVEGDAERFLVPVFARNMGIELDQLGTSVCSVSGTNFLPYSKLLTHLGIPFSIVTDWDPREGGGSLGRARVTEIARAVEMIRVGGISAEVEAALGAAEPAFRQAVARYGCFLNDSTLEVSLFREGYRHQIIAVLLESGFGPERRARIAEWGENPETFNETQYLAMIEEIGKGRFAQRLAARVVGMAPPAYIRSAIEFLVNRA